jgi:CRISPR/Cas system-associated endonuclease Cas3-HD
VHLDKLQAAAIAAALIIHSGMDKGKRGAKDELEGNKKKKAKNISQGVKASEKVSTRWMKDMRFFFSNLKPIAKVKAQYTKGENYIALKGPPTPSVHQ